MTLQPKVNLHRYKWPSLQSIRQDPSKYSRYGKIPSTIDWTGLADYASGLRGGEKCQLEESIALGGRHVVRILTFTGGIRWVIRVRIPSPPNGDDTASVSGDTLTLREVDCLRLITERTSIPVPRVMGFGKVDAGFGAPFILMECLSGDVAMDINFDFVPQQFKASFFKQMANAQVQTCNMLFPRIGIPILLEDGTVDIGPIPGIGGPFDTASAFFRAWAAKAEFPLTEQRVKECCGPLGDEVWECTESFPDRISEMADVISSIRNEGPFPLVHVDFGHNNIVVDPEYNILGVIDWEHAMVSPWEAVGFPLTVRVVPKPMGAPWNYDADGLPNNEALKARYEDRGEYLKAVEAAEAELEIPPLLSKILRDEKIQNVAAAMKLYSIDGKMGFYTKVLDVYQRNKRPDQG